MQTQRNIYSLLPLSKWHCLITNEFHLKTHGTIIVMNHLYNESEFISFLFSYLHRCSTISSTPLHMYLNININPKRQNFETYKLICTFKTVSSSKPLFQNVTTDYNSPLIIILELISNNNKKPNLGQMLSSTRGNIPSHSRRPCETAEPSLLVALQQYAPVSFGVVYAMSSDA